MSDTASRERTGESEEVQSRGPENESRSDPSGRGRCVTTEEQCAQNSAHDNWNLGSGLATCVHGQDLTLARREVTNHCFNRHAPIWLSQLSNRPIEGMVLTVLDPNMWFGASQSAGRLMRLLANIFAIVVAGSSLAPVIANGQVVTPERIVGRVVVDNFQLLPARPGIPRPISQEFLRSGTTASALTFPLTQTHDSSQSNRAMGEQGSECTSSQPISNRCFGDVHSDPCFLMMPG